MLDITPTTDLYDQYGEAISSCDTQFREFGAIGSFDGEIVTIRSHEDNVLLKKVLAEPGAGKVVVVEAGGTTHCAMMGDKMAETAVANGWAGAIINGAIRDAKAINALPIGIKALGTNPRRSQKHGDGHVNVPLAFGGVIFTPGARVVSDEDGIVVLT